LFFKSIRFTLTLWYSVTLAVILVLFCAGIYFSFRQQIYREIDRELLTIAEALASPTLDPFRDTAPSVFDQVLEDFIGPKGTGKFIQILDGAGAVKSGSKNLNEVPSPVFKTDLHAASRGKVVYATRSGADGGSFRSVALPVFTDGRLSQIIQVGTSLHDEIEDLNRILLVFFVSIPLSLLLLGAGGWFLAGRALKPVEFITRSARRITAENLGLRLVVANPRDEIGRLAETFNATLARLEDSFARTRRFSVDVSHELRTPLTILQGNTEIGLKWAKEPDEFRSIMQSNLDEIHQMSAIVEHLLELSRADEGKLALVMEEVELSALLRELVQQAQPLTEEKGVALSCIGTGLLVHGDRKRLRRLFGTLLDNAVRYTPAGGDIRVSLEDSAGWAKISVRDSGVGISKADLPRIFDRFYRVDEARNRAHGGSGLGLSLAKSFAEAHGGEITVESTPGEGSVFVVSLPLVATATPMAQ
jgi:heavy metal sensor kinase